MNLNTVDISKLPADIRRTYKQLMVLHAEKQIQNKAKNDFLSFVKCVWPDFIEGSHHRHIAKKFNDLSTGKLKRLIVNMPPQGIRSQNLLLICCLPGWWAVIQNSRSFKQPTLENSLLSLVVKPSTLLILKNMEKIFQTRLTGR